jgi:hypothetical protein
MTNGSRVRCLDLPAWKASEQEIGSGQKDAARTRLSARNGCVEE